MFEGYITNKGRGKKMIVTDKHFGAKCIIFWNYIRPPNNNSRALERKQLRIRLPLIKHRGTRSRPRVRSLDFDRRLLGGCAYLERVPSARER